MGWQQQAALRQVISTGPCLAPPVATDPVCLCELFLRARLLAGLTAQHLEITLKRAAVPTV